MLFVVGRYLPDVSREAFRLDLLNKRAFVADVDLTPSSLSRSHVFLLGNVPFALSRGSFLSALNISYQTDLRIEALGLRLCLEQVPYSTARGAACVNEAFFRKKRASQAEGERKASGIFGRLLQRYLPVLMNRLQISFNEFCFLFRFEGGAVMVVSVDSIETMVVNDKNSAAGDVSRDVVVKDLKIEFNDLTVLHLAECVIMLRYSDGEYSVDIRVVNGLHVSVNDAVASQALAFKSETELWNFACLHRRPIESIVNSPKSWWLYAARCITKQGGAFFQRSFLRSRIGLCKEYESLHLQRLNRRGTDLPTLERCQELEYMLDVDTVLFLRSKAGQLVAAERAKQFAVEDWLRWAFFAGKVSRSQDADLLQDMGEAATNLEGPDDSTFAKMGFSPGADTPWTRTIVSLELCHLDVTFASAQGNLSLDVKAEDLRLDLSADSHFISYVLTASCGGLVVADDRTEYLQRNRRARYALYTESADVLHACNNLGADLSDPAVSKIFKLSVHRDATKLKCKVRLLVAPLRLHIDASRLTPLLMFVHTLFSLKKRSSLEDVRDQRARNGQPVVGECMRGQPNERKTTDLDERHSTASATNETEDSELGFCSTLFVHCADLIVVISSGSAVCNASGDQRNALLVSCTNLHVSAPCTRPASDSALAKACLSIVPCVVTNDLQLMRPRFMQQMNDRDGFVRTVRAMAPLLTDLHVIVSMQKSSTGEGLRTLNFEFAPTTALRLCQPNLELAKSVVHGIMEELGRSILTCSHGDGSNRSRIRPVAPPRNTTSKVDLVNFMTGKGKFGVPGASTGLLSSLRVTFGVENFDIIYLHDSRKDEAAVVMRFCKVFMEGRGSNVRLITVTSLELFDAETECYVKLIPSKKRGNGLVMDLNPFDSSSKYQSAYAPCTVSLGVVESSVNRAFMRRLLAVYVQNFGILFDRKGSDVTTTARGSAPTVSLTLTAKSIRLIFDGFGINVSFRADGLYCVHEENRLEGHVENVELSDLRGDTGVHQNIVRGRDLKDGLSNDIRRLRFSIRPGHVNIYLMSLQIMYFGPFVFHFCRAVGCIKKAMDRELSRPYQATRVTNSRQVSSYESQAPSTASLHLGIRGNCVLLVLPGSLSEHDVVVMDLSETTISSSPDAMFVSVKNAVLMTGFDSKLQQEQQSQFSRAWSVVSPVMNIDMTRRIRADRAANVEVLETTESWGHRARERHDWTFQIYCKELFLTSSQIALIWNAFADNIFGHQLYASDMSSSDTVSHCHANGSNRLTNSNIHSGDDDSVEFSRNTVRIGVSGLVVELFEENAFGKGRKPLASCFLGFMGYSRDSLSRYGSGLPCSSTVTRSSFEVMSICIVNRQYGVIIPLQLVFAAQPTKSSAPVEESRSSDWFCEPQWLPCLQIQMHHHVYADRVPRNKIEVVFREPKLIFCPGFLQALVRFFSFLWRNERQGLDNMSRSGELAVESELQEKSENFSQLSVQVCAPQVYSVEKSDRETSYGVLSFFEELKLSLSIKSDGSISDNSHILCRNAGLLLGSAPKVTSMGDRTLATLLRQEHGLFSCSELEFDSVKRCGDARAQDIAQRESTYQSGSGRGTKESVSWSKLSMLDLWSQEVRTVRPLIRIRSLDARCLSALSVENAKVEVEVVGLQLSCSVRDIVELGYVLPRLEIPVVDQSDLPCLLPACAIFFREVSVQLRIPEQGVSQPPRYRPQGHGSSILRLAFTAQIDVTENTSSLLIALRLVDSGVFYGQTSQWDSRPVAEPATVALTGYSMLRCWSLEVQDALRINMTPSMVEVFVNLFFGWKEARASVQHTQQVLQKSSPDQLTDCRNASPDCDGRPRSMANSSGLLNCSSECRYTLVFRRLDLRIISDNMCLAVLLANFEASSFISCCNTDFGALELRIGHIHVVDRLGENRGDSARGTIWNHVLRPTKPSARRLKLRRTVPSSDGLRRQNFVCRVSRMAEKSEESHLHEKLRKDCELRNHTPAQELPTSEISNMSDGGVLSFSLAWDGVNSLTEMELRLVGMSVHIDGEVLRHFVGWFERIRNAIALASSAQSRADADQRISDNYRNCHVVLEPVRFDLSFRAPRKRSSMACSHLGSSWILENLFGSEETRNLRIAIPRIVAHRDEFECDGIWSKLRQGFKHALLTRQSLGLTLKQLPTVLSAVRTSVSTYMRGGLEVTDRMESDLRGFLDVLGEFSMGLGQMSGIYPRVTISQSCELRTSSIDARDIIVRESLLAANVDAGQEVGNAALVTWRYQGAKLFSRLLQQDRVLRRNKERFQLYVPFSLSAGLFVTNVHLLVVNLVDESILEPRIPVSVIAKYTLENDLSVIVHCGRHMNLIQSYVHSRDTGAFLDKLMSLRYSLVCDDKSVAHWLAHHLPTRHWSVFDVH